MEEPIRRTLGLTQKKFMDVLAGRDSFQEATGPAAIQKALDRINLPEAVKRAEQEWRNSNRLNQGRSAQALGLAQAR